MQIITSENSKFWELYTEFHKTSSYTSLLSKLDIEYSKAYAAEAEFKDVSFLILDQNIVIATFTASIQTYSNGNKELNGYGREAIYLEKNNLDKTQKKQIEKVIRKEIISIINNDDIKYVKFTDELKKNTLSDLGRYFLDLGAKTKPYYSQIIDLTLSETVIKTGLRKRYKGFINWGNKNLRIVRSLLLGKKINCDIRKGTAMSWNMI